MGCRGEPHPREAPQWFQGPSAVPGAPSGCSLGDSVERLTFHLRKRFIDGVTS